MPFMASLWLPYGFLMASLWLPYGFPMALFCPILIFELFWMNLLLTTYFLVNLNHNNLKKYRRALSSAPQVQERTLKSPQPKKIGEHFQVPLRAPQEPLGAPTSNQKSASTFRCPFGAPQEPPNTSDTSDASALLALSNNQNFSHLILASKCFKT